MQWGVAPAGVFEDQGRHLAGRVFQVEDAGPRFVPIAGRGHSEAAAPHALPCGVGVGDAPRDAPKRIIRSLGGGVERPREFKSHAATAEKDEPNTALGKASVEGHADSQRFVEGFGAIEVRAAEHHMVDRADRILEVCAASEGGGRLRTVDVELERDPERIGGTGLVIAVRPEHQSLYRARVVRIMWPAKDETSVREVQTSAVVDRASCASQKMAPGVEVSPRIGRGDDDLVEVGDHAGYSPAMRVRFFATLRTPVGGKAVELALDPGSTVRDLVAGLVAAYPDLGPLILAEDGSLSRFVHVFINGRGVVHLPKGLDTILDAEDEVDVFPAVAGGAR